ATLCICEALYPRSLVHQILEISEVMCYLCSHFEDRGSHHTMHQHHPFPTPRTSSSLRETVHLFPLCSSIWRTQASPSALSAWPVCSAHALYATDSWKKGPT